MGFYRLQFNITSITKRSVDTTNDVVNDVTCTRKNVITRVVIHVVIRCLLHDVSN